MRKRELGMILLALAALGGMAWAQLVPRTAQTGAWGLSFQQEHLPPQGPGDARELARFNAAYLGNTEEKVIYLTFDAGYENGCTERILDVLRDRQVPAAFFLVGNYLQRNPDLVRRMVEEGHIVGNHTMNHPDMSLLTDKEAFARELTQLEDLFREVTGKELPKYYRPPQGLYTRENLKMAREMGYQTVFWSLAYGDWDNDRQPTREEAFQKLLPRIHNGAVVLLHATSETNARILDELITQWTAMGYSFASLDALFDP